MKTNIFEAFCYKEFIKQLIDSMPKRGRGQYKSLSEYLKTSTVAISQIFKGERDLTPEQAYLVAKYFKFDSYETTYFLHLVDYAKAGHFELKDFYKKRLRQVKAEAIKVKGRMNKFKELKDKEKAVFYSDANYSKVRLASSLEGLDSIERISEYLNLPVENVDIIIEFLLASGLCQMKDKKLDIQAQHTLLTADSPFVKNHHVNWRINSMQKASNLNKNSEVMFTLPMSLSHDAFKELHKFSLKLIKDTYEIVNPSEDECLAYMGIDLYRL